MSWAAIVPLKPAGTRKSRLADRLTPAERIVLSEAMVAHVAGVLAAHDAIDRAVLLAAHRPSDWTGEWRRDEGRGLNAELEAAASGLAGHDLVVAHADLPLFAPGDLDALLAAGPVAFAPDARDRGTNALAVRVGEPFEALFGEDSFARFRAWRPDAAIVRRPGLALDIDTPDDLARAEAAGFVWRYTG